MTKRQHVIAIHNFAGEKQDVPSHGARFYMKELVGWDISAPNDKGMVQLRSPDGYTILTPTPLQDNIKEESTTGTSGLARLVALNLQSLGVAGTVFALVHNGDGANPASNEAGIAGRVLGIWQDTMDSAPPNPGLVDPISIPPLS